MCVESVKAPAPDVIRSFDNTEAFDRWIRSYLERKRAEGPVVFLDSQLAGHAASREGFIASNPVHMIRARDGIVRNGSGKQNAWEALKQFRETHPDWMFGWLAYDLKNETEVLFSRNRDPVGLPDLFFFVPAVVIAVDRKTSSVRLVKGEVPEADDLHNDTVNADEQPSRRRFRIEPLESGDGWQAYRDKILKVQEHITAGNTYEVNLTHQLNAGCAGDTLDLFDSMREAGPVPFAAWIHYDDVEVCCSSPERFLQRQGHIVRSQPIKGTSPRGATPGEDERIINGILQKEKNRAENVMIVDLVRNDLGRVARTGSVQTESLLEVQSFSTVHQLVSTIKAELKSGTCSVDVIKACFPMGSMTGAPKIRTMQIIEELESYRRGLYSGAVGYFTPEDDFDLNVVIRTAIRKQDRLYYSVGGAVTADSDPREEWEETWLKAKALQR